MNIRYPAITDIRPQRISGHSRDLATPDIRYPAFRLARYPTGQISGKISILCVYTVNTLSSFLLQPLSHTKM